MMNYQKEKVEIYGNKYQQIKTLGQGAYAEVYACKYIGVQDKDQQTQQASTLDRMYSEIKPKPKIGEFFAIKKFKESGDAKLGMTMDNIREIKFMQQFNHPNIVKIIDVFITQRNPHQAKDDKAQNLMIVMPHCVPISKLAEQQRIQQFDEEDFRCMFKQILLGVNYLHQNYILHRDIKWENLLIDKDRKIVITDFGLSREFGSTERQFTANTFTTNYRPPEILLGSTIYGPKSDMWAIGVVFVEILMKFETFLFPLASDDTLQLLTKIFALRGTPSQETWKDFDKLPIKINFTPCAPKKLKNLNSLTIFSDQLINIIESLLDLNPNKRPSAAELLELDYFKKAPEETERYELSVGTLVVEQKMQFR